MDKRSLDEQAADLAEKMLKGGAAGDMPSNRSGDSGAEGGFTTDAGGQVIDAGADGGMEKGLTGAKMTSEPKAQNSAPKTGAAMNSEPKGDSGSGQPGEGGNLSQTGDEGMRARKPGQIGVSGSMPKGNLSENEDQTMRARKTGKVGMSKAEMAELGLSQSQMELAEQMGLVKGCKKADVEIEVEDGDEEDDEAEKGEVSVDDLNKSLDALEAVALGSTVMAPKERRAELAEKLSEGSLTKAEMTELADLMKAGGAEEAAEELAKSDDPQDETQEEGWEAEFGKSWQEEFSTNESVKEAYDASAFLEAQSQLIAAALDQTQDVLKKALEDDRAQTGRFNVALAKSLKGMAHLTAEQGDLIKSLAGRLEQVENTPLPRKGVGNVRALQKSVPNEAGMGAGPGREQILDTLERMSKLRERSAGGERLDYAVTLFEQDGQISKSLYNEVVEEMRKSGGVGIH